MEAIQQPLQLAFCESTGVLTHMKAVMNGLSYFELRRIPFLSDPWALESRWGYQW